MGRSSGTRILFWAWIVSSASCPRSSSDQDASALRGTTFLAAFPDARLSPVVARRSGSPDSAIDLTPDPGDLCPDHGERFANLKSASDSRFRQVRGGPVSALAYPDGPVD